MIANVFECVKADLHHQLLEILIMINLKGKCLVFFLHEVKQDISSREYDRIVTYNSLQRYKVLLFCQAMSSLSNILMV